MKIPLISIVLFGKMILGEMCVIHKASTLAKILQDTFKGVIECTISPIMWGITFYLTKFWSLKNDKNLEVAYIVHCIEIYTLIIVV